MPAPFALDGRHALVTGCGSASASASPRRDCSAARRARLDHSTTERIHERAAELGGAFASVADLTDAAQASALAAAAHAAQGPIDVLVNNAGMAQTGTNDSGRPVRHARARGVAGAARDHAEDGVQHDTGRASRDGPSALRAGGDGLVRDWPAGHGARIGRVCRSERRARRPDAHDLDRARPRRDHGQLGPAGLDRDLVVGTGRARLRAPHPGGASGNAGRGRGGDRVSLHCRGELRHRPDARRRRRQHHPGAPRRGRLRRRGRDLRSGIDAAALHRGEAAAIAAELFGLAGEATDLGSERDQTFLVAGRRRGGVLKISNSGEDPATLDLEAAAIAHVAPRRPGPARRAACSASAAVDGLGRPPLVRLFERLHGRHGGPDLRRRRPRLRRDARAARPRAARLLPSRRGPRAPLGPRARRRLRPLVAAIADVGRRAHRRRGARPLRRARRPALAAACPPRSSTATSTSTTCSSASDGRISGIVDFGDIAHSAPAADLAIAVASLVRGRPRDDVFRAARIAVDGYASRCRSSRSSSSCSAIWSRRAWRRSSRSARGASTATPRTRRTSRTWDDDSWALLERFDELGPDAVARELGAPRPPAADGASWRSAARRRSARC